MKRKTLLSVMKLGLLASAVQLAMQAHASSSDHSQAMRLATGQYVTPTVVAGAVQQFLNPGLPAYPNFVAGEAVRSQLSPDGTTLAVICAGQNSLDGPTGSLDTANSTQYIFVYDVSGSSKSKPALKQVIKQTNSHVGLVFSPDGGTLYAAGGADDAVYAYTKAGGNWSLAATIALGHAFTTPQGAKQGGVGLGVQPNASGLGISADGKTLVVANNYNDSISVIDTATRTVRYEHDLRPFFTNNERIAGGAGGTFPFAVVVKGNGLAYVSSDRDREVVVVDISSATAGHLVKRIKLDGNALGMALDASGSKLYVAEDNADQVAVIDTLANQVVEKIDARAPAGLLQGGGDDQHEGGGDDEHEGRGGDGARAGYTGAATFAVTLSPDGGTLYAVNAAANSIAVIPLKGEGANKVKGLIPTAYEPHDITFSADGSWMYIVNGKSVTGPNPAHLNSNTAHMTSFPGCPQPPTPAPPNQVCAAATAAAAAANAANQYQFQLERASLVSAPVPKGDQLEKLTEKVAQNNFYGAEPKEEDTEVMGFLRDHIKHIIYIVKENRTYDQILGDLGNGANGDPNLTQFGQVITPNFHRLSKQFVTLDNFNDPGDGSMDGWSWSLQGRVTNTETITQQINYAFVNRGLSYESEGMNRNAPVNYPTVAGRDAVLGPAGTTNYTTASAGLPGGTANLLAGGGNHASSDAPFGIQKGYIFDAVLQSGGTVRNYGFLVNNFGRISINGSPVSDPFAAGEIQVGPLDPALAPLTDVYFRGYDQNYPDLWRYNEWKREFDGFVSNGNLPSLSLVRVSHDHMGSFGTALGGVNTPERQQADDDLSVGLLVQAVAHSRYASSTLVIVIEDDCQDGPDHVDSHRATAYVVGPYVKQGAVVSTHYGQVNALRTIEDILGTPHINLNTAFQRPMTHVFDIHSSGAWSYDAVASKYLNDPSITLGTLGVMFAKGPNVKPTHDATYWARVTAGFDFTSADMVPPDRFNRVIWKGMMGSKPYPKAPRAQLANTRDKDDD